MSLKSNLIAKNPLKAEAADKIRCIIMDIDGVLTDGGIGWGPFAEGEIKFFNVRDGAGIKMASRAGILVGCLSGRESEANRHRSRELKLDFLYEKCLQKKVGLEQLLKEQQLAPEECMYIGDDLIDIPAMRCCGIGIAVADGADELDLVCHFRTSKNGGRGAVREAIEWLLKEQGKWEEAISRYFV